MSAMAAAAPAVGRCPNNAPEKPSVPEITDNGFIEAFNSKLRAECLNAL